MPAAWLISAVVEAQFVDKLHTQEMSLKDVYRSANCLEKLIQLNVGGFSNYVALLNCVSNHLLLLVRIHSFVSRSLSQPCSTSQGNHHYTRISRASHVDLIWSKVAGCLKYLHLHDITTPVQKPPLSQSLAKLLCDSHACVLIFLFFSFSAYSKPCWPSDGWKSCWLPTILRNSYICLWRNWCGEFLIFLHFIQFLNNVSVVIIKWSECRPSDGIW